MIGGQRYLWKICTGLIMEKNVRPVACGWHAMAVVDVESVLKESQNALT